MLCVNDEKFTLAKVQWLTHVLRNGRNRRGLPVHQLCMTSCKFENDDSLLLLRDCLANNECPHLKMVGLDNMNNQQHAETLVLGLSNNKTVQELFVIESLQHGTSGGTALGTLLERNHQVKLLDLGPVSVEFLRAAREGLVASRGRLTSLEMGCEFDEDETNNVLRELLLIYDNNNDQNIITALSKLSLSEGDIGREGCILLRRLLASMPHLYTLDASSTFIGPDGAVELFQRGSNIFHVPWLDMNDCNIGNVGIAQMAASMPSNSPLVYLDLVSNRIEDRLGGAALAALLVRCPQLETLYLSGNPLGPEGAQALAPGFANHPALQLIGMSSCDIADDGSTQLITSLATIQCLKRVDLDSNYLPPAALVPLTTLLNQTHGVLEELSLNGNRLLFRTANDNERRPFFDAIAKHQHIQKLDISDTRHGDGMNRQTKDLLSYAVLKNKTLRYVDGRYTKGMRRKKLLTLIETTMTSPDEIRFGVWPVALGVWAPRVNDIGSHYPIYRLIQKMAEVNAFALSLAREKAYAKMIQRSWRRHRPTLAALHFRKSQIASLKAENTALRAAFSKQDDHDDNDKTFNGGINHAGSLSAPSSTTAAHHAHHPATPKPATAAATTSSAATTTTTTATLHPSEDVRGKSESMHHDEDDVGGLSANSKDCTGFLDTTATESLTTTPTAFTQAQAGSLPGQSTPQKSTAPHPRSPACEKVDNGLKRATIMNSTVLSNNNNKKSKTT